jgi:hypothetical protein
MGLTKAEIADLIKEIKGGGDNPNSPKYQSQVIYKIAEIARNFFIKVAYNLARNEGQKHVNGDFYSRHINVPILKDSDTNRFYFKAPAKMISLPHMRGMRSISLMEDIDNPWNIVPSGSGAIFAGLEADDMGGPEAYPEGDRWYLRHVADNICECPLLVVQISSIDNLDEDAVIPIPAEFEADYIDKIKEMLDEEKATPQDKHNDSNLDTNG